MCIPNKKSIIFVLLIVFFLTFLLYSNLNRIIPLSITGLFKSIETETDVVTAIKKLINGQNEIIVEIMGNNVCYWVKPSYDGTKFNLQVNEYETPVGNCIGIIKDVNYIELDEGMNVLGDTDCLCSGGKYLLEWKVNGLKISKR